MRLAAISIFFLTFAVTVWIANEPATVTNGLTPIGPLPLDEMIPDVEVSASRGPDLAPEPPDDEDLASLNGCANDPDMPAECRVVSIRRLLTHYLRPPANSDRVRAVLTDARWATTAYIGHVHDFTAQPMDSLWRDEKCFRVYLLPEEGVEGRALALAVVRLSGIAKPKPDDLRAFLSGEHVLPSNVQIEEIAWLDRYSTLLVETSTRDGVRIGVR